MHDARFIRYGLFADMMICQDSNRFAKLCGIRSGTRVLEIASGTGETACFLREKFQSDITCLDVSTAMVEKARRKAVRRGLAIEFRQGDAHQLPFEKGTFEIVICECSSFRRKFTG